MCLSEASCLGLPRRWRREIGSIETSRSSFRRRSSMIMTGSRARSPLTSGNRGGVRPNFRTLLIRWVRCSIVLGTSLQVAAARGSKRCGLLELGLAYTLLLLCTYLAGLANSDKVVAQNQLLRPFTYAKTRRSAGAVGPNPSQQVFPKSLEIHGFPSLFRRACTDRKFG